MRPACPLCAHTETARVVQRRGVPVHQNLIYRTADEARAAVRHDLDLVCCAGCGFIWNRAFDERLLEYGQSYVADQAASPAFLAYLASVADLLAAEGLRGGEALEVGSGSGAFLRVLSDRAHCRGYGFDRSYAGPPTSQDARVQLRAEDATADNTPAADVVLSRHVIEHIPDPLSFLRLMAALARKRSGAFLYVETPDVSWILERVVVQDFFYEHCSYFDPETLAYACGLAGFARTRLTTGFGGQYLWAVAREAAGATRPDPARALDLARRFSTEESAHLAAWRHRVAGAASQGGVALWGAGAKGTTFAAVLDAEATRIRCLVDINPAKQSCFVPVTGHPIVGPAELGRLGIRTVVVMNPNYLQEVRDATASLAVPVMLVTEAEP
jgi:SAM-dependent methyltransferase